MMIVSRVEVEVAPAGGKEAVMVAHVPPGLLIMPVSNTRLAGVMLVP